MTPEQDNLLRHVRELVKAWAEDFVLDEKGVRPRLEGLAFSFLVMLDGQHTGIDQETVLKAMEGTPLHELFSEEDLSEAIGKGQAVTEASECARLRGALWELEADDGRRPPEQRLRPEVWWKSVLAVRQLKAPARDLEACTDLVFKAVEKIEKVAASLQEHAANPEPRLRDGSLMPRAHLLHQGVTLCGTRPDPRFRAIDVIEWLAMAVRKDGTPFCKACARRYRTDMNEEGKSCTRCNGVKQIWDPVTSRGTDPCPQCAGAGAYPKWAAAALEADPLPPVNPKYQETLE